jgi:hypothetical protein
MDLVHNKIAPYIPIKRRLYFVFIPGGTFKQSISISQAGKFELPFF